MNESVKEFEIRGDKSLYIIHNNSHLTIRFCSDDEVVKRIDHLTKNLYRAYEGEG